MLPDNHPAVVAELERRTQVRAKAMAKDVKDTEGDTNTTIIGSKRGVNKKSKEPKSKVDGKTKGKGNEETSDSGTWQLTHQQLAESRISSDFDIVLFFFVCVYDCVYVCMFYG